MKMRLNMKKGSKIYDIDRLGLDMDTNIKVLHVCVCVYVCVYFLPP